MKLTIRKLTKLIQVNRKVYLLFKILIKIAAASKKIKIKNNI